MDVHCLPRTAPQTTKAPGKVGLGRPAWGGGGQGEGERGQGRLACGQRGPGRWVGLALRPDPAPVPVPPALPTQDAWSCAYDCAGSVLGGPIETAEA